MDISRRSVNLEPYGVVFIKDRLKKKGVSPVWYINNMKNDKYEVLKALCSLIETHQEQAYKILLFVATFGKKMAKEGAPKKWLNV